MKGKSEHQSVYPKSQMRISLVVQSLRIPANAGDTGLTPGLGRLHTLRGNCAHVLQLPKPTHLESVLHSQRSHNEKSVHRDAEWRPLATARESWEAATKTQSSQN